MYIRLGKILFWGLLISFLGSLPLGSLNLITTYLSVSKGVPAALAFSIGCVISEFIFVRVAITSLNWLSKRQKLFKILEWITIAIILVLAVYSFIAAIRKTGFTSAMPADIRHPFWSGVLFSTIDPMRIPFWFTWSTFLIANKVLIPTNQYFNFYVVGIAIGSLLGFLPFIYGGTYFIGSITSHQNLINWAIGGILLITAAISIYRTLRRKPEPSPPVNDNDDMPVFIG
jgi:threonine/homoserine/homoserine lactone efflux protein